MPAGFCGYGKHFISLYHSSIRGQLVCFYSEFEKNPTVYSCRDPLKPGLLKKFEGLNYLLSKKNNFSSAKCHKPTVPWSI